ncbi:MAG: gliding motility-like protein [Bacteroidetes bacterium]|nr:MAG: gliding motility-like protein [Bacteroidota bacterium]
MNRILLSLLLVSASTVYGQLNIDTLAFQDFEITPASPVWTFTGPVIYNSGFSTASAAPPNSPIGIGGSRAWETTTNSGGLVLDFANVTIPPGYDSIRVRYNLAAMNLNGSTGGPDNLDYVLTAVSTDGGTTYYNRLRIRGATTDNCFWAYSATGVGKVYYQPQTEALFQPTTSGLQTTLGFSTCEIVFPGSVTQVRVRITGRSSSSTDTWLVDNLVMAGENICTSSSSSISPVACNSYTSPGGSVFTSSGTYADTIPNSSGCDSIISINLTVNNGSSATIAAAACGSYLSPAGNTYTSSGMYMDTIPNSSGCDSVITINLTVNNPTAATISPVNCGAYLSPAGNTYTSSGMYMDTIPNSSGCDSVITINLTVNTIDTSTSLNGATITANATGVSYQWIDCNNGNAAIPGANGQSYLPVANGSYAVIVTDSVCSDTSSCVQVLSVGMNMQQVPEGITISPNPSAGIFTVSCARGFSDATCTLTDMRGRIVFRRENLSGTALTFDITENESGFYFLEIRQGGAVQRIKLAR